MIAYIEGKLKYKSPEYVIIDVGGIGYQVYISLNTFCELPEPGERTSLNIHTHVREDALDLFGFNSLDEKGVFLKLVAINGIGPRLAVNILSGITPGELEEAVFRNNLRKLQSVPGVGKKIAQRIILELKDKLRPADKKASDEEMFQYQEGTGVESDAISALLSLGYKPAEAEKAVRLAVGKYNAENIPRLEELLRETLRLLAR